MGVQVPPGAPLIKREKIMQKMTPSKIFRKTEAATELAWISGSVIVFGILAFVVLSYF